MPTMSAVEQAFCRSAPWRGFARRVVLPWALQGLTPRGHLLELGSGSGAMAEGTAQAHPDLRLTVTDLDPAMVAACRRRLAAHPQVTVAEADVTDLPFEDGSFDVVASYLMLHHVIGWQQALGEAARVLRPGGTFVGYDLDRTRLAEWVHIVDRSPYHLIAHHEFGPALTAAGFDDVQVSRALGGHVVTFVARRENR
jgi:ubiquinone/menaquinone biosynthesis C-methylase UbiE